MLFLLPLFALSQWTRAEEWKVITELNKISPKEVTFIPSIDNFTLEVRTTLPLKLPKVYYNKEILPLLDMKLLASYGLVMVRLRYGDKEHKYSGKVFYEIP
tara:strand:- start:1405 stop:1707 length:303 start_codon:yes stop_codon:yes gene_type:complete